MMKNYFKKLLCNKTKASPSFDELAYDWWNPTGKFKLLHDYNKVRFPYLSKTIQNHFKLNTPNFSGLDILDVGCGGGLIAEKMAELQANITAIDTSANAIKVAKQHALKSNLDITYLNQELAKLNPDTKFDVILILEILEHVDNLAVFMNQVFKFLKPNGIVIFSTINRNLKSLLLAKITAEYILHWLPKGIHEYKKFIKPIELENLFNDHNYKIANLQGVKYNLMEGEWALNTTPEINYIGYATKLN